jgi:hypothetical protein
MTQSRFKLKEKREVLSDDFEDTYRRGCHTGGLGADI